MRPANDPGVQTPAMKGALLSVTVLAFTGAAGLTACAAAPEEDAPATDSSAVIGGTETREAPEVGKASFSWGSYCTATLIAPRVAITASHCVDYRTRDASGSFGRFYIEKAAGGTASYAIDRYRAFARDGLGDVDVALIRLRDAVPADVATPARYATTGASNGTDLVLYGYGCNDNWEDQTGGGVKRKFNYDLGTTLKDRLCPGDSGGPVRIRSNGTVLKINSGWMSDWWSGRRDVFGDVPRFAGEIAQQISAWSASEPTTGLRAEYFDAQDLSGAPKVTRFDRSIDFDWGEGAPAPIVEGDSFSVRWTAKLDVPTAGSYTIEAFTDDGVRVFVDGRQIVSDWTAHSPASRSGSITLTAGLHDFKMEYFEQGGGALAKVYWSGPGIARQLIPSYRFKP